MPSYWAMRCRSWLPSTVTARSPRSRTKRSTWSDFGPRLTRSPTNHTRSAAVKLTFARSCCNSSKQPCTSPIAYVATGADYSRGFSADRRARRFLNRGAHRHEEGHGAHRRNFEHHIEDVVLDDAEGEQRDQGEMLCLDPAAHRRIVGRFARRDFAHVSLDIFARPERAAGELLQMLDELLARFG